MSNYPDMDEHQMSRFYESDYPDDLPSASDLADDPKSVFWKEKKQRARGFAPEWEGEDAPSYEGWDDIYTDEDEPSNTDWMVRDDQDNPIAAPFDEDEPPDDSPFLDPDHGREDRMDPDYGISGGDYDKRSNDMEANLAADEEHRVGAILRQSEQWP